MFSKLISMLGFDKETPNNIDMSNNVDITNNVDILNDEVVDGERSIIEQIHNEFDTAPDRLLQQAIQILEKEGNAKIQLESQISEKAKRLEKIGFVKNDAVVKKQQIDSITKSKQYVIDMSTKEAETINHYSRNYPFLKFLTEPELDRICEKYGLIYAPVSYYKETVPDKNLREIENAQPLNVNDKLNELVSWEFINTRENYKLTYDKIVTFLGNKTIFTEDEIKKIFKQHLPHKGNFGISSYECLNLFYYISGEIFNNAIVCDGIKHVEDRRGYFIAAPKEHFDLTDLTENKENKGFYKRTSVIYKDPIVFRYVKGGIQVITKWGLEADDEALQVGVLN